MVGLHGVLGPVAQPLVEEAVSVDTGPAPTLLLLMTGTVVWGLQQKVVPVTTTSTALVGASCNSVLLHQNVYYYTEMRNTTLKCVLLHL